ncbi:TRAP transporter small permease subunit [Futiania mangrovi]|uniref:TRAP transporter small permease protein n=1 Tax=Futiania mangrovi TaxID=2959716 RepID=A0A9J6PJC3_9PROT|nr:TRAP transporter small permease [Futiania mangrovii]MCP1336647.1 TRAP transporter small permease [Futiania mangrovii]
MAHALGNRPTRQSAREGFIGWLDYVVWQIERAFTLLSSLFIFGLMMIGVVQVFGRKLFDAPIFGYIDMVELAMTTFAFLAISYTERLGGHVRMELLVGKLKGRVQWAAEFASVIVALFVVAILIYYGWTHTVRAYEFGDSTIDAEYPMWPSKLVVPIAFSLLWIRLLVMAYGYARLFADPERTPIGVPVVGNVAEQAKAEAAEALGADAREGGR